MDVYRVGELWRLMHKFGNRIGESWRFRDELDKQEAQELDASKPGYETPSEYCSYLACRQPADQCETQPVSRDAYELRLYWLCRQHAELKDAEKEWEDSISDLFEWEQVLDEALRARTKEEVVGLLQKRCGEQWRLSNEFAAYADSLRYTGQGKHPLE